MTKQERSEMYRKYLTEEGYAPKIDDDGDVRFKYEGRYYFIAVDENDEEFFQLVFPNFWTIESDAERDKVAKAAIQATAKTKVAKVFPVNDNTWALIEMFCSPHRSSRLSFDVHSAHCRPASNTSDRECTNE